MRLVREFLLRLAARLARQSRGQSLVELALMLPILLMLVGGAMDLGRAYAATIALDGSARAGALYAARNPQCVDDTSGACSDPRNIRWHAEQELNGVEVSEFEARCYDAATVDVSGVGKNLTDCADGDRYRVTVSTQFTLITPFISAIITGPIDLSATSSSVVLTSFDAINGAPVIIPQNPDEEDPAVGTCIVPNFTIATKANQAENVWNEVALFTGSVTKVGSGNFKISWQSQTSGAALPCNSNVTVSNSPQATPTPVPTPTPTPVPTPTPSASASGSASPTATPSATPIPTPTPTPIATCKVPDMTQGNTSVTQAQGLWQAAGFKASNFSAKRPPDGDYKVKDQSIPENQWRPCLTTTIIVENN